MTRQQYDDWKAFREKEGRPTKEEAKMIARMYADIFNKKYWLPCGCNGQRWQSWIDQLNELFLNIDRPAE